MNLSKGAQWVRDKAGIGTGSRTWALVTVPALSVISVWFDPPFHLHPKPRHLHTHTCTRSIVKDLTFEIHVQPTGKHQLTCLLWGFCHNNSTACVIALRTSCMCCTSEHTRFNSKYIQTHKPTSYLRNIDIGAPVAN